MTRVKKDVFQKTILNNIFQEVYNAPPSHQVLTVNFADDVVSH